MVFFSKSQRNLNASYVSCVVETNNSEQRHVCFKELLVTNLFNKPEQIQYPDRILKHHDILNTPPLKK